MESIKCNHMEAMNLVEEMRMEKSLLQQKIEKLSDSIFKMDEIISTNNLRGKKWILEIPAGVLMKIDSLRTTINWKGIVFETIERYDCPFTTETLVNKIILRFKEVPTNKRFVLKNISAALYYLCIYDNKLTRMKQNNGRGYVYGLRHHFNFQNELKLDYLKKFKIEEGKESVLSVQMNYK